MTPFYHPHIQLDPQVVSMAHPTTLLPTGLGFKLFIYLNRFYKYLINLLAPARRCVEY